MSEGQLRIGDAERDQAAAVLGEHYAQGRLTAEEHAERLDRIWAARTHADLAPLFRDLPGGRVGPSYAPAERRGGRLPMWRWAPTPVLVVLGVLLVLTVLTHLPLVLATVLVVCLVSSRRRWHATGSHWSRWTR